MSINFDKWIERSDPSLDFQQALEDVYENSVSFEDFYHKGIKAGLFDDEKNAKELYIELNQ